MNYDKIILELLSRVQNLEEEMAGIKNDLAARKLEEDDEDGFDVPDNEMGDFSRSQARDKAMEIIRGKFPDYLVEKASRREGSGIKIIKPDENASKPIFIKFSHSRTYGHRTGAYEHAWHTINLEEIINYIYDFCLFSIVDKNGEWNFLLYRPEELGIYRDENRSASSDLLHLYFVIKDGKACEVREKSVDVTDHLNNWKLLG